MDRNTFTIEQIKKLRKKKKITLKEMAQHMNKSKSAWLRKERGIVELTLNEIDEVAKVLQSDFNSITNIEDSYDISGNYVNQGSNPSINLNLTNEQFEKFLEILISEKMIIKNSII